MPQVDAQALGALITACRQRRGLSVHGLATTLKMADSHLARIEAGDVENVGLATLARLAGALEVDVQDLVDAAMPRTQPPTELASVWQRLSHASRRTLTQIARALEWQERAPAPTPLIPRHTPDDIVKQIREWRAEYGDDALDYALYSQTDQTLTETGRDQEPQSLEDPVDETP